MSGRALVVAAHGSAEHDVNDGIRRLALRVGARLRFDEAIAAFHKGDPEFSRALDGLRSDDVTVVPLLQSEGYYCHRVLPSQLARNRRFASLRLRQTRAVGVHPALGGVLARRVVEIVSVDSLETPAVALVGHGTPRHRGSRQAAETSARDVERRTGLRSRAFFLDEEPAVESILAYAPGADLVVLPLLIGAGRHATRDLARRLGIETGGPEPAASGGGPPAELVAANGPRTLVLDRPFGLDPAIEEIVVDLVRHLRAEDGAASSISVNRPSLER